MHLYVLKWDVNLRRGNTYDEWAKKAIDRSFEVPGVQEVRAFRPIAGESQVVVTFAFEDFEAWSRWFDSPEIQRLFTELFGMAWNVKRELWEPSPLIPEAVTAADRKDG